MLSYILRKQVVSANALYIHMGHVRNMHIIFETSDLGRYFLVYKIVILANKISRGGLLLELGEEALVITHCLLCGVGNR